MFSEGLQSEFEKKKVTINEQDMDVDHSHGLSASALVSDIKEDIVDVGDRMDISDKTNAGQFHFAHTGELIPRTCHKKF